MTEFYTKEQIDAMGGVTGARIRARSTPQFIDQQITALNNKNLVTDAQLIAIGNIPPDHFKGDFANLADIPTAGAVIGDYAVLTVVGGDDTKAIWDNDAGEWIDTGAAVTGETAASIKSKYESNPNTNAFTDAYMAQLDGLSNPPNISDFTAALDGAINA